MHEGCRGDHLESHSEKDSEDNSSRSSVDTSSQTRVRKADLLDDYELERPDQEEEDHGIEIQEATGGQVSSRARKLEVYYNKIEDLVEKNDGELKITSRTHVGTTRGFHIVRKFKQAVRRVEDTSLEEWEIEGDQNKGSYPIWIRRL